MAEDDKLFMSNPHRSKNTRNRIHRYIPYCIQEMRICCLDTIGWNIRLVRLHPAFILILLGVASILAQSRNGGRPFVGGGSRNASVSTPVLPLQNESVTPRIPVAMPPLPPPPPPPPSQPVASPKGPSKQPPTAPQASPNNPKSVADTGVKFVSSVPTSHVGLVIIYIALGLGGIAVMITGVGHYRTTLFFTGSFIFGDITLSVLRMALKPYLAIQASDPTPDPDVAERILFIYIGVPAIFATMGGLFGVILVHHPVWAVCASGGALLGAGLIRFSLLPVPRFAPLPAYIPFVFTLVAVPVFAFVVRMVTVRGMDHIGKMMVILGTALSGALCLMISIDLAFSLGVVIVPGTTTSLYAPPVTQGGVSAAAISEFAGVIVCTALSAFYQTYKNKKLLWFGQDAFDGEIAGEEDDLGFSSERSMIAIKRRRLASHATLGFATGLGGKKRKPSAWSVGSGGKGGGSAGASPVTGRKPSLAPKNYINR